MKLIKILIATVALSGALVTTANARDSFSIGINIGGHDYAPHNIRTYHHEPAYYGHHRSAPRVTYYAPQVRYRHYRRHGYSSSRHYGQAYRGGHHYRGKQYRGNYYSKHARKHSRKHHRRAHKRGYGYHNGWR